MSTKDKLLKYLKENRNTWISGQRVSNELDVSRAAIWKQVKNLKNEGYDIESSPRKGYHLNKDSELLLPNEIREGLRMRFFSTVDIHYHHEIGSTNTYAKDLAENGAPEGTLVIAESQSKGRGRRGRQWYSSPKNGIYASIILRPSISPMAAPKITLMTAVAVAEALLSQLEMDITIKWPNDILVKGKKLVGILSEISTDMDAVNYIIVGLGMNVNTPPEDFPPDVRDIATSVFMETGKPFSRVRLMRAFLEHFEKYYNQFNRNEYHDIMLRWKALSKAIGKKITVDVLGQKHMGEIMDVDDDGILILKDDQGKIQRIISGDIAYPPPAGIKS